MRDAAEAMDRALANDRTASDGILDAKLAVNLAVSSAVKPVRPFPNRPDDDLPNGL